MAIDSLPFATLPVSRWANGAGRKADIASGSGWMIGFAWLDADAPFSDYTGQDRTITLVDGPGFQLDFAPPHPSRLVRSRHEPTAFDGGWPTRCHVFGPSLVLNAMTARGQWCHEVRVLTVPTHIAPASRTIAFVVDLVSRDSIRVGGPLETTASPCAHVLFTPIGTG